MNSAYFSLNLCAIFLSFFVVSTPQIPRFSTPLLPLVFGLGCLSLGFSLQLLATSFLRLHIRFNLTCNILLLASGYTLSVIGNRMDFYPLVIPFLIIFLQGFLFFPPPGDEQRLWVCGFFCTAMLFVLQALGLEKGSWIASFLILILFVLISLWEDRSYPALRRAKHLGLLIPWLSLFAIQQPILKELEGPLFEATNFEGTYEYFEERLPASLPVHHLKTLGVEKFSSESEQQRYLCLVSLPLHLQRNNLSVPRSVLILGGADGLAARNALGFASVKKVVVVDADESLYGKAKEELKLRIYNLDSLKNTKVTYLKKDPLVYLNSRERELFDTIVVDLPPQKGTLQSRLVSKEFHSLLLSRLEENGVVAVSHASFNLEKEGFPSVTYENLSGKKQNFSLITKKPIDLGKAIDTLVKGPEKLSCKRTSDTSEPRPLTLSSLLK